MISRIAAAGASLGSAEVADVLAQACPPKEYKGKKILLIVPDGTRTAPIGQVFQALFRQLGHETKSLDVLIALGTHQPMSEAAICARLEISELDRRSTYGSVRFFNHA